MTSSDRSCLNQLKELFDKHDVIFKMGCFQRSIKPDDYLSTGVDVLVQMYTITGAESMLFSGDSNKPYSYFFDLGKVLQWQAERERMRRSHPYDIDEVLKGLAFLMRKYQFSFFAYAIQADRMRGAVYGPRTYFAMKNGDFFVEKICCADAVYELLSYQDYLTRLSKENPDDK